MKTKNLLLILIIVTISQLWGYSQSEFINSYGNKKVVSISVNGLTRTSQTNFLRWIEVEKNNNVTDYNIKQINDYIDELDLFSPEKEIDFYNNNDAALMIITVEEKISLIALPFFSSSGEQKSFGGMLIDNNVFGSGLSCFALLMYGSNVKNSLFALSHKRLWHGRYAISIYGLNKTKDIEMADIDNNTFYKSQIDDLSFGFDGGVNIVKKRFYTGLLVDYLKTSYSGDNDDVKLAYEPKGEFLDLGVHLTLTATTNEAVFENGWSSDLKISYANSLNDNYSDFKKLEGTSSYSYALDQWGDVMIQTNYGLFNYPQIQEMDLSKNYGSRTVPSGKIFADDWINGAVVFEHFLYQKYKLTQTLSYYYETGYYHNDDQNQNYHGIGTDYKIYFSKIAIPAISFGASYNFTNELYQFNFSIGTR